MWIRVKIGTDVILCGIVYHAPENSVAKYAKEDIISILSEEKERFMLESGANLVILCGDFNARIGEMSENDIVVSLNNEVYVEREYNDERTSKDKIVNARGRKILDFCSTSGMYIANGRLGEDKNLGEFTCVTSRGSSVVDYLMMNEMTYSRITDFRVDEPYLSDHCPLFFKVQVMNKVCRMGPIRPNDLPKMPTRIVWDDTKQNAFTQSLHQHSSLNDVIQLCNTGNVDKAVEMLNYTVFDAAKAAGMRIHEPRDKRTQANTHKEWYDKPCGDSKRELSKKLRHFRKHHNKESLQTYNKHKRRYRNLLKRKKREHKSYRLQLLKTSLTEPRKFWTLVNGRREEVKNDINPSEWYCYFKDLFEQFARPELTSGISEAENSYLACEILDQPIERNEISTALRKLKSNKSTGVDGIPSEIWKFGNIEDILGVLFNAIFQYGIPAAWKTSIIVALHKKGDVNNPANYRGISLLVALSKLYSSILNTRFLKWEKEVEFFSDTQNGFRPKRSTVDGIFVLNTAISSEFERKNVVYCAYVDFLKCYDSIPRNLLFQKLVDSGVSPEFVRKLKILYENVNACVKIGGKNTTETFPCPSGLRQGCILSSTLFISFLNDIEDWFITNNVTALRLGIRRMIVMLFADDLVIVDKTIPGLQEKLNLLADYCEKWGVIVNSDKTKVMAFRPSGRTKPKEKWTYLKGKLETVRIFEYLGINLCNTNSFNSMIKDRVDKGKRAMSAVFGKLSQFPLVPVDILLKIFDTKIVPVLTYGSEIWGVCDLAAVEKVASRFYRIILRLPSNTSIDLARGELGRRSLKPMIYKRVMKYWLKLLNASPDSMIAQSYRRQFEMAEKGKDCWGLRLKKLLFALGFGYVWVEQEILNIPRFIHVFYTRCVDIDYQNWHSNLMSFGTLRTYRLIKSELRCEQYLKFNLPKKTIRVFTRLRGGLLGIGVNLGRWATPHVPYADRKCEICNLGVVEDEFHVLFICPAWSTFRLQLMNYMCFKNKDLKALCNTENRELIKNVVKLLEVILFERREILEVL